MTISMPYDLDSWEYAIIDQSGRILERREVSGTRYEIGASLSPGVYTLSVSLGENQQVFKRIIKR